MSGTTVAFDEMGLCKRFEFNSAFEFGCKNGSSLAFSRHYGIIYLLRYIRGLV